MSYYETRLKIFLQAFENCILTNIYGEFEITTILRTHVKQQSGAEEACWAHNPEVGGSKPPSATYNIFFSYNLMFI